MEMQLSYCSILLSSFLSVMPWVRQFWKILALDWNRTQAAQPVPDAIPTEVSRLLYEIQMEMWMQAI
jgi:hypothetical protein